MAQFSYTVTLAPGAELGVHAETTEELMEQYGFLGGDPAWLVSKMKEMVPATERGEGVGALQAVLGEVVDDLGSDAGPAEESRGSERTRTVRDPWSDKDVQEPDRRRSAARTEPSRGTSGAASGGSDGGPVEKIDRFGGKWVLGLPDAPNCDHGQPAALKTWKARTGKLTTAFVCAKGAPDSQDWSDKCDFFEFPPR